MEVGLQRAPFWLSWAGLGRISVRLATYDQKRMRWLLLEGIDSRPFFADARITQYTDQTGMTESAACPSKLWSARSMGLLPQLRGPDGSFAARAEREILRKLFSRLLLDLKLSPAARVMQHLDGFRDYGGLLWCIRT